MDPQDRVAAVKCELNTNGGICFSCAQKLLEQIAVEVSKKLGGAGDEHLGEWVYCGQHLRPHKTGWCSVSAANHKKSLKATTEQGAYQECRERGFKLEADKCAKCMKIGKHDLDCPNLKKEPKQFSSMAEERRYNYLKDLKGKKDGDK